jgi:hypothetical protein
MIIDAFKVGAGSAAGVAIASCRLLIAMQSLAILVP